jgi:hypothetical protein
LERRLAIVLTGTIQNAADSVLTGVLGHNLQHQPRRLR